MVTYNVKVRDYSYNVKTEVTNKVKDRGNS